MRLNVFHYPLAGWTDSVVMNVLMGNATVLQLGDLAECSYQPLAEAFRAILPRERRHMELGVEALRGLVADPSARVGVAASLAYWHPRVAASFGSAASTRFETQRRFGLRRAPKNPILAGDHRAGPLGSSRPPPQPRLTTPHRSGPEVPDRPAGRPDHPTRSRGAAVLHRCGARSDGSWLARPWIAGAPPPTRTIPFSP